MTNKKIAQQNANKAQNEKRLGTPTFSTVRFQDKDSLDDITKTIKLFGGTKEASLIAAYKLLKKSID